ncbi:MAG: hypothetical protein AAGG01_14110 [Planctomycetota bacterium]
MLALLSLAIQQAAAFPQAPPTSPSSLLVPLPYSVRRVATSEAGRYVAFTIEEQYQTAAGIDLNGDGDTEDTVMGVHDQKKGVTTLTDLDARELIAGSGFVMLLRNEEDSGIDVTGDGTTNQNYLSIYDFATGSVDTPTEAAGSVGAKGPIGYYRLASGSYRVYSHASRQYRDLPPFVWVQHVEKEGVFFREYEYRAGQDLNGDGDLDDSIMLRWNTNPAEDKSLGFSANAIFHVNGSRIVGRTSEAEEGRDIDGDGFLSGYLLFASDLATGSKRILGKMAPFSPRLLFDGDLAYFRKGEKGIQDLNGDGDLDDFVLVEVNAATGAQQSFSVEADPVAVGGGRLAYAQLESEAGIDLTGNGSISEALMDVVQLSTGTALGLAQPIHVARSGLMDDRYLVYVTTERGLQQDITGDGSTFAEIIEVRDLVTGASRYLPHDTISGLLPEKLRNEVPFVAVETTVDLNGDGDTSDSVLLLHQLRLESTVTTNVHRSFNFSQSRFGIAVTSLESWSGSDLNGDGDQGDRVLFVQAK